MEMSEELIRQIGEIIDRYNYSSDRLEGFSNLGFSIMHYFDMTKIYHKFKSTDEYLLINSELILWINDIDGIIMLYKLEKYNNYEIPENELLFIRDNNHCKYDLQQEQMSFYMNHHDMKNLYIKYEYNQEKYDQIMKWGE